MELSPRLKIPEENVQQEKEHEEEHGVGIHAGWRGGISEYEVRVHRGGIGEIKFAFTEEGLERRSSRSPRGYYTLTGQRTKFSLEQRDEAVTSSAVFETDPFRIKGSYERPIFH